MFNDVPPEFREQTAHDSPQWPHPTSQVQPSNQERTDADNQCRSVEALSFQAVNAFASSERCIQDFLQRAPISDRIQYDAAAMLLTSLGLGLKYLKNALRSRPSSDKITGEYIVVFDTLYADCTRN